MAKVKDFASRKATAIVHDAFSKDANQRTFTRVYIADHSYPNIVFFSDLERGVH
jgi:hypothetical protein